MANKRVIDELVTQEALDKYDILLDKLQKSVELFKSTAVSAKQLSDAIKAQKSLPSLSTGVSGAKKEYDEMKRLANELIRLKERLKYIDSDEAKQISVLRQEIIKLNAERKKEIQNANVASSSLVGMRAELGKITKAYDLLSKEVREGAVGKNMLVDIKQLTTALNTAEQATGRFGRNVGNYASGFSSLSNSIAQLTREAPAFANGAQTGFMALSNNFAALFDAIKKVRLENKALAADGKKTKSVLRQMGAAFFSLNTIVMAAVTALTLYGDSIVKYISALFRGRKAIDSFIAGQEAINEALEDSALKDSTSEYIKMSETLKLAAKGIGNVKEVLKEYNDKWSETLGVTNDINKANDKMLKSFPAWFEMMTLKTAAMNLYNQAADIEIQKTQKELGLVDRILAYKENLSAGEKVGQLLRLFSPAGVGTMTDAEYRALEKGLNDKEDLLNKSQENILKAAQEFMQKYLSIESQLGGTPKGKKEKKKKGINRIDIIRDGLEREKLILETHSKEILQSELGYYDSLMGLLQKYHYSRINGVKNMTKDETESYIKLKHDVIVEIRDLGEKIAKEYEKIDMVSPLTNEKDEDILKSANETAKKYLQYINDTFKKEPATLKINLDVGIDQELIEKISIVVNKISDYINISTNALMNLEQQKYQKRMREIDNEEERIKQRYDAEIEALEKSGKTAKEIEEEKIKIEAKADIQRKRIEKERRIEARKIAKSNKQADIANILSGTAVAVVNALGNKPFTPYNLLLAGLVGAAGAAQLRIAVATPLPEYYKGTDYSKEGYARVAERGQEMIIEPSGKKYLTPHKETIMYLKKGSKVITNDKLKAMAKNVASNNLLTVTQTNQVENIQIKEAFNNFGERLDKLNSTLEKKKMSLHITNYGEYAGYIKKRMI